MLFTICRHSGRRRRCSAHSLIGAKDQRRLTSAATSLFNFRNGGCRVLLLAFYCFAFSGVLARGDNIAFFYALEQDFQSLKAQGQEVGQPLKAGVRSIAVLELGIHRVYAVKMGSGAVETAASTQALLAKVRCDAAFSVGVVGGLADKLRTGSWYRVSEVISYQRGSWTRNGFQLSSSAALDQKSDYPTKGTLPVLFQNVPMIKVASGEVFVASDNYRA